MTTRRFRVAFGSTLLALVWAIAGIVTFGWAGPASAAGTPPWEPDPNSVGGLLFFNAAGQQVTGAAVTPFSLQLPIPSRAFVVNVNVALPGGGQRVVTDNAVAMFSGRYMGTVDVSWSSDAPLGSEIVQQQSRYEATRLSALAGAG